MDTTKRSPRILARALGSALAVGIVGVGVLPAGTAQAAGIRTNGLARTPATVTQPVADPAALPATSASANAVRYRVVDGRLREL